MSPPSFPPPAFSRLYRQPPRYPAKVVGEGLANLVAMWLPSVGFEASVNFENADIGTSKVSMTSPIFLGR